jgi:hypothetical protein
MDAVVATLPSRGLGILSRATVLATRAASEAIRDAGMVDGMPDPAGLVVGTCRAHHESIIQQFETLTATGELRPILGLNGGVHALAARLAIRFRTRAFAYTVPSDAAGLDAVLEAARMLSDGHACVALAGGVEAPMARADQADAAAFLVLVGVEGGAQTHAALTGWASSGTPEKDRDRRRRAAAVVTAAVARAGQPIERVLTSGSSDEDAAIDDVFGPHAVPRESLGCVRGILGEPIGVFQLAIAASSQNAGAMLIVQFSRGKLCAAVVVPRSAAAAVGLGA